MFFKKKHTNDREAERASFILPNGNDGYELTLVPILNNRISLGNPVGNGYSISSHIVRFSGDKTGQLVAITHSGTKVTIKSFDRDYVTFAKFSGDIANRYELRKESDTFLINVSVYRNSNVSYRIKTQEIMGLIPEPYYPNDSCWYRVPQKPWWQDTWWPIQGQNGPFLKINGHFVFINWANPDRGITPMLEFYKNCDILVDEFCGDLIRPQLL